MTATWLVLDALGGEGGGRAAIRLAVRQQAARQGVRLDVACLSETDVTPCRGCFGCWTKTPGLCLVKDDVRALTAGIVAAQKVVLLTPVVFGGYAAKLKIPFERAVLPSLLPFFKRVSGRTRHLSRYGAPPALAAIGWQPKPDVAGGQVFAGVVARNAANMRSPSHASCVVSCEDDAAQIEAQVQKAVAAGASPGAVKAKTILVLCGSPKISGSASAALGQYVETYAAAKGATVRLVHLAKVSDDAEAFAELAHQLDTADGVCLTYPLYADQLPGQVLRVLARLAERRREIPPTKPQRFFAVANCGFPEAVNNDVSLEMCRLFAAEAGFAWMGGCAVGGGGLYQGRTLAALGWLGRRARAALTQKAALLLAPEEPDIAATGNLAVPCPLPVPLYLFMAESGWKKAFRRHKGEIDGYARPDAPSAARGAL